MTLPEVQAAREAYQRAERERRRAEYKRRSADKAIKTASIKTASIKAAPPRAVPPSPEAHDARVEAKREKDRLRRQRERAAIRAERVAGGDGHLNGNGRLVRAGPVSDPTPEEIRERVNELRREKGLPEV
jgi:hypothetical protein